MRQKKYFLQEIIHENNFRDRNTCFLILTHSHHQLSDCEVRNAMKDLVATLVVAGDVGAIHHLAEGKHPICVLFVCSVLVISIRSASARPEPC